MALFKKQIQKPETELEKLPLKELERSMPQNDEAQEKEKARKEKGSPARSGKF